jgi:hypothetical protein
MINLSFDKKTFLVVVDVQRGRRGDGGRKNKKKTCSQYRENDIIVHTCGKASATESICGRWGNIGQDMLFPKDYARPQGGVSSDQARRQRKKAQRPDFLFFCFFFSLSRQ